VLFTASVLVPGQIFQFPQCQSVIVPVRITTTVAVLMIILVISDFNLPYLREMLIVLVLSFSLY